MQHEASAARRQQPSVSDDRSQDLHTDAQQEAASIRQNGRRVPSHPACEAQSAARPEPAAAPQQTGHSNPFIMMTSPDGPDEADSLPHATFAAPAVVSPFADSHDDDGDELQHHHSNPFISADPAPAPAAADRLPHATFAVPPTVVSPFAAGDEADADQLADIDDPANPFSRAWMKAMGPSPFAAEDEPPAAPQRSGPSRVDMDRSKAAPPSPWAAGDADEQPSSSGSDSMKAFSPFSTFTPAGNCLSLLSLFKQSYCIGRFDLV